MDKKSHSNGIFSRLDQPLNVQLKPLSVYSRMVAGGQEGGLQQLGQFSSPLINFKIEIVNNYVKKRKLDDCNLDHGHSSPVKKLYSPNIMSPDLGCFMDCSSPFARLDSVSPSAPSYPALCEKTHEIKKPSSQQHLKQEELECPPDPGDEVETEQWKSKSEKILSNLSSAFDVDVDGVLCLSPSWQGGGDEVNKELKLDLIAVEEDKGYLSTSDVNDAKEECHAKILSEPQCHEQAPIRGHCFSSKKDLNATLEEPPSTHMNHPAECLEGGVEDVWNIGVPIFESSLCQSDAVVEHREQMSEDFKEPNSCLDQSTLNITSPLQVQVKSKVVVQSKPNSISKKASSCWEEKASAGNKNKDKTVKGAKWTKTQRPTVFNNMREWEDNKRQYVLSVTNHMTENQGTVQGVMTELRDLMTHVDKMGSNGPQWQHPSDLTCRNYQKRFGNEKPTMTLGEWQAKNLIKHKRFCKVSKIFERSPLL